MSKNEIIKGRQEPTHKVLAECDYDLTDQFLEFFGSFGVSFHPYQIEELHAYLARNRNADADSDDYANSLIGVSRPRQTGKSYAAKFYSIWESLIFGKSVLYTAQNLDTVLGMFRDVRDFSEGAPDIAKHIKPGGIYQSPIQMSIAWTNGGIIHFRTRSKSLSRGKTHACLIFDECQELLEAQLEAVAPTIVASKSDSQILAIGTPPGPECQGTVFKDWHDQAHDEGLKSGIAWLEWAAPAVPADITNEQEWIWNPGIGYLINEKKMRSAAAQFAKNPLGFAREYLGYWSPGVTHKAAIQDKLWDACKTTKAKASKINGPVAYGVKFAPDGASAYLAACARSQNKEPPYLVELVEVYDLSDGIGPLADWLANRLKDSIGVAIDGASNSETLVEYLRQRGVNTKQLVKRTKTSEYAAACAYYLNGIKGKSLVHCGYDTLTESTLQIRKRPIGKDGAFGFAAITSECESGPAEAAALAYWLAGTNKRNPGKKQKVSY